MSVSEQGPNLPQHSYGTRLRHRRQAAAQGRQDEDAGPQVQSVPISGEAAGEETVGAGIELSGQEN